MDSGNDKIDRHFIDIDVTHQTQSFLVDERNPFMVINDQMTQGSKVSPPTVSVKIVLNIPVLVTEGLKNACCCIDVIRWKHFPRYWPFVRGIHRSPVNSPHKGQWRGALMFSLICVWIHGWVYNREAGDLRRYPAHYDVTGMEYVNIYPP